MASVGCVEAEVSPESQEVEGESCVRRRSARACVTRATRSMYVELPDDDFSYEEESEKEEEVEVEEAAAKKSASEGERRPPPGRRLRRRAVNPAAIKAEKAKQTMRKVTAILRKPETDRTTDEKSFVCSNAKAVKEAKKRERLRERTASRKLEIEESSEAQIAKCERIAAAVATAKNLVVYTGAGISTAANIPDYRGPNGIWTLLDQGKSLEQVGNACRDLALAKPTLTHMALMALYKRGKLKHVVSQNCDGLHLRSGIPRYALSELHGNMFVEVCTRCKPIRPFVRLFDVTGKTSKNRHTTGRRCHVCGTSLIDSIVHFGERGSLKWPLNWDGARKAAEKADVVLCLGSSLKVLRRYPRLWCMDRQKHQRPELYIVNLQWTPKDGAATLKLNGRCDDAMRRVMAKLGMDVPEYSEENDPLLSYCTRLHAMEEHTSSRRPINFVEQEEKEIKTEEAEDCNGRHVDPAWTVDHDYCDQEAVAVEKKEDVEEKPPPKKTAASRNGFSKRQPLDFKSIAWPRDALYNPHVFQEKLEFVQELESAGRSAYYCDCCDPSKKRKRKRRNGRRNSSSSTSSSGSSSSSSSSCSVDASSDEDTSAKTSTRNSDDEDGSTCSKSKSEDSTSLSSVRGNITAAPAGWFGKGRRSKRYKN